MRPVSSAVSERLIFVLTALPVSKALVQPLNSRFTALQGAGNLSLLLFASPFLSLSQSHPLAPTFTHIHIRFIALSHSRTSSGVVQLRLPDK